MSIVTPDGILNVENATLRVPSIEVQGVNVTTALSTLSNVGIGTASPDERLHVHGPDAGFILQSNLNSATMEIGGPGGAVMDLKGAFTDDYDLRIKTTGTGGVISSVGEANHLVFGAASGYTGFGVASPQFKIDAQGSAGVDAVSNPITHNSVILYDDQESTTTFSGTSGGSSSGRDTTNKYYELNSLTQSTVGYIHWPIQLPNSFTAEFERYSGGGSGGHNIIFSFFNTSAPTTDGDNGGYKIYISERYGGSAAVAIKRGNTELKNAPLIGYTNATWQKVVVSYDRGSISVSFNNKVLLTYKDAQQAHAYTGKYMGFLGTTDSLTNYHRVRNVKITSGSAKWLYTETDTSNASTLVYLSGNVGIGTQTPTELLEVSGNVKVSSGYHLMGDGGLISNIATTLQSISDQGNTVSNTIQFTNTTTGLTSTGNVEVTNNKFFKGDGGLISNIATTLGDIVDQGNTTSNTIIFSSSNVGWRSSGNVEVINNKFFKGDGGLISNIATTLQAITDQGNVASNTLQFTNTDVAFITTANVGIANSAPTVSLSVGSNLHVDEYGSNVLDIVGNVSMSNLTLSGFGIEASYGLQHVTAENATTAETITMTHASKALDITSNVEMGGTLKFDSNAAITSVTGDVINQGFMEQPTQGLTNYRTYIEGHGTYEASASSEDINNSFNAWEAFDSDTSTRWAIGSELGYNTTSGEWDATAITNFPTINTIDVAGTRHSGHWLQIKLPYQIVLSHSNVFPLTGVTARAPKDGVILGSNDGEDWYELQRFTGKTYTDNQWTQIDVNAETPYQYFRMCITKLGSGHNIVNLTEWRLFAKDRITKLADNILLNGSIASDTLNTGYVKWPKVPLLADSYKGYEVSVSSQYDATVPGYLAFNGIGGHLGGEGWTSGSTTFDATTGAAHSSNAALFDGVRCEWIQLKLPRNKKIKLSHFVIAPRTNSGSSVSPEDAPKEGAMYGSNDGTTWTKLITYSGLTYGGATGDQSEKVVVRSDTKYQYFRLTVTKRNIATVSGTFIDIAELGLFERSLGVAQNPDKATLQVGGSLGLAKGSEIFAGDDIVMELDGPHDRPLVKYPEIKMTANSSGGYVASASSTAGGGYYGYEQHNGNTTDIGHTSVYDDSYANPTYSNVTGNYNLSAGITDINGTTYSGEWVKLQLPVRVKLTNFKVYARSSFTHRSFKDYTLLGSNDGTGWYVITNGTGNTSSLLNVNINESKYYSYYVLVAEKIVAGIASDTLPCLNFSELEYYGYEEGDVSTDLVWSPVYNKPGTQHLDVYWDANDRSSYMGTGTTVNDLSGNGVTGTITGNNGFDAEYNAWVFDGSGDYISGTLSNPAGDWVHSVSCWVSATELSSTKARFITRYGVEALRQQVILSLTPGRVRVDFNSDSIYKDVSPFVLNTWYHIAFTYSGGGTSNVKIYINGVDVGVSGGGTTALNIASGRTLYVGKELNLNYNDPWKGSIANFRLFGGKVLNADQVRELYDWQKDFFFGTKSTMTLTKGNLGLGASSPTDRLEVVGRVKADSSKIPTGVDRNNTVIRRETGPHDRPLTKYPEIAMTANDNSSTSGYVADQSSTNGYADGLAYRLFDHSTTGYQSGGSQYSGGNSTSSAQTTTATDGSTHQGVAITLDLATKIRLSYAKITSHTYYGRTPVEGTFLGSNDNSTWDVIGTFDGLSTTAAGQTHIVNIADYATKSAYRYIRLVVTKIHTSAVQNGGTLLEFRELEYYGTEEGDVSTDLVWSSVYNKPGTQHLGVYWDANDSNSYAGSGTTVTDLSGNGVTGTLSGVGFDSTYNAFTFDGSNDTITTTNSGLGTGGSFDHSFAFWFKINRNISNNDYVVTFGEETNDNMIAVNISGNSLIHLDNWGRGVITGDIVRLGTWYHVACTHTGSATGDINNQLIYVNGVRQTTVSTGTGTLAFTSNKITIGARPGGGTPTAFLDGAVSNVRFFKGKALNADQVRELYEYDAPRFGHRQNLVSLHKGNLGVGVSHPTSRFEVAGTETLQEYPPKAMTDYETYIEGHGVFRASASSERNNGGNATWHAFDSEAINTYWINIFDDDDYKYAGTSNTYSGISQLSSETPLGEYITLECPYKIIPQMVGFKPYSNMNHQPLNAVVYGSNDGYTWTFISSLQNMSGYSTNYIKTFSLNNTSKEGYRYVSFITTQVTGTSPYLRFFTYRIYGTPAPSALEDGHLTLGKALTLPRVSGHAAGAETPRAESLLVHYDTTVDSVASGTTVVDSSGAGNNGSLINGATYDSTARCLHGDGPAAGHHTNTPITISGGAMPFSISMWFRPETFVSGTSVSVLSFMGNKSVNEGVIFSYRQNAIWQDLYGKGVQFTVSLSLNRWYHVTTTYNGGNIESGSSKMYLDGVEIQSYLVSGTGSVNLPTSTNLELFDYINGLNDRHQGDISNFKLWNVALTTDEVAMEYALGRTGKSLNLTDTSLCLGGTVPRAQLDVRGGARFDGRVGIGSLSPTGQLQITSSTSGGVNADTMDTQLVLASTGDNYNPGNVGAGIMFAQRWWNNASSVAGCCGIYSVKRSGNGSYGGDMAFYTGPPSGNYNMTEKMRIMSSGNVGIGMTNPDTRLTLKQSEQSASGGFQIQRSENTSSWQIYINANGTDLYFAYNGTTKGYLDRVNSAGLIDFTGQHRSFIYDVPYSKYTELEGLIVSANKNKYFTIGENIHTGSNAIQISESLPLVSLSTKPLDKACFGVISGTEDPETRKYAQGTFTSVMNKQEGDVRAFINSLGEGAIWVTNANGPLESGDYITTSNVAGYGMKQEDDVLHNYTVAKITMDCDFAPVDEPIQQIVKERANVNYWVNTTYSNVALEEYSKFTEENRRTVATTQYSNEEGDISLGEYSNLESNVQATYSEIETVTYQKIERKESTTEQEGYTLEVREELVNVLDEHGQLQWEDHPTDTEKAYKIRYLDADGKITTEANKVHTAAFVGCTYHCG